MKKIFFGSWCCHKFIYSFPNLHKLVSDANLQDNLWKKAPLRVYRTNLHYFHNSPLENWAFRCQSNKFCSFHSPFCVTFVLLFFLRVAKVSRANRIFHFSCEWQKLFSSILFLNEKFVNFEKVSFFY